jgi:trimeric autotransporter adhesin
MLRRQRLLDAEVAHVCKNATTLRYHVSVLGGARCTVLSISHVHCRATAMTNSVQVLLLVAKAWSAVTSAFGTSPHSDVAEGLNTTTTAGSLKRLHSSSSSSSSISKSSRALQSRSSGRALLTATAAAAAERSSLTWQPPQPPLDCDSDRALSLTALRSVLTGYSVRLSSEEAAWVLARLGSSYDLSSGSTVAAIAAATPRKGDRSSVTSPRSNSSRRAGTTPRQRESAATAAATAATAAAGIATAGAATADAAAEHDALLAGRVTSSGSSVVLTADGQQQQQPAALLKQVTLADFFYAVFDVEAAAQVSLQPL